jgi:hypothetical protein
MLAISWAPVSFGAILLAAGAYGIWYVNTHTTDPTLRNER